MLCCCYSLIGKVEGKWICCKASNHQVNPELRPQGLLKFLVPNTRICATKIESVYSFKTICSNKSLSLFWRESLLCFSFHLKTRCTKKCFQFGLFCRQLLLRFFYSFKKQDVKRNVSGLVCSEMNHIFFFSLKSNLYTSDLVYYVANHSCVLSFHLKTWCNKRCDLICSEVNHTSVFLFIKKKLY